MGARSTGSHPTTTKADGHLLEYFRSDMGAGGAQYVFDNVSYTTWAKAYRNSVFLYNYLHRNQNTFNRLETENCVQVWCAEMWGVLWSLWDDGHKSIINKEKYAGLLKRIEEKIEKAEIS